MGRKPRRSRGKTDSLAALAVLVAAAALAAGCYLEYRLRPYRLLYPFTSEQRGWRDQAFEVAMYSGAAAVVLILLARLVRKM